MISQDVILFMGQSNMAGRGEAKKATVCDGKAGVEFRAISNPSSFVPLLEPFGKNENVETGIDDSGRKKGSLVSAFVQKYYQETGRQVIAVSASEGGTTSAQWKDNLVKDGADRLQITRKFLKTQGITPEHIYMIWCQGESDGDNNIDGEQYKRNMEEIWNIMKCAGAEHCFVIQIGHFNYKGFPEGMYGIDGLELDRRYGKIRKAQEELCQENSEFTMAATFETCLSFMKDQFHYHQEAYELVGKEAAVQAAAFHQ